MQKKFIVAAVAAAVAAPAAMAQTAVTITGLVKMGVEQYKQSSFNTVVRGAGSFNNETRVSDQSSRIIFRGTEDLGGGLNAFFQLDARFSPDLGAIAASGNTMVGLGGGFGKVSLGRSDLHYSELGAVESNRTGSLQSYAGPGIMSQVNGTSIANVTRTPNVVMYDSPNMGGFSGRAAYSANFAATEGSGVNNGSKDGAWNVALRYAAGPIKAGYSYWNAKAEGATDAGDQRGDTLYGGYAFGPVSVGLAWNKSQFRAAASVPMTKRNAWMLPVSFEQGPHTAQLVYAAARDQSGGAAGQVNNDTAAKMWRLSYEYALSKRTAVGVHYTKLDNKSNAAYNMFALGANGATANVAGEDSKQLYLGLGHTF